MISLKRLLLLVFCCASVFCTVEAQYHTTGADPWSVRFRQMNRQRYRLIYDEPLLPTAKVLASMMDTVVKYDWLSMHYQPKRIDVVLHSRMAYSNGLVSWAPSRLEMYTYPTLGEDCVPWLQHLAIHEYRHVVQSDMVRTGFTKGLYYVFGEQAIGLVLGLYAPRWLLEGDAVAQETALTHGGRGRTATFEQEFRAISLMRRNPTYDEAYNGSLKWQYPNYYHMGYLTVSATRLRYGQNLWANALTYSGKVSWSITPFNRSLRRQTGKKRVALYNESVDWWKEQWLRQDSSIVETAYNEHITQRDYYDEYVSPRLWRGNIVAYKTSPEMIERLVVVDDDGKERTLHVTSPRNESDFDIVGDTIVWCERRAHTRWENAAESCIMIGNLPKGKFHRLTRKGFYASPSLSADGRMIAVVRTDTCNNQHLSVISTEGADLSDRTFGCAENIASPCWLDNRTLAFILISPEGKSVNMYNIDTKEITPITEPVFSNVSHLTAHGGRLYFANDSTGVNNIYTLSLSDSRVERITSARFGADWPYVSGDTLYYADYSDRGYKIVSTNVDTRATDSPTAPLLAVADKLTELEGGALNFSYQADSAATDHTFSRFNVVNFHSWGPIIITKKHDVRSGVAVASQDLRGTTIISAGFHFDDDYSDEALFASVTYNALFPKISLDASWGYEKYDFDGMFATTKSTVLTRLTCHDRKDIYKLSATISQPLTFNSGAWLRQIEPSVSGSLNKETGIEYTAQDFRQNQQGKIIGRSVVSKLRTPDIAYREVNGSLYMHLLRRMAVRDIGYRCGVYAQLFYVKSFDDKDLGSCHGFMSGIYMPGFARHHQIAVAFHAQRKNIGESYREITGKTLKDSYNDVIPIARGYSHTPNTDLRTIRFNYNMPLLYPDLSIGGLTYIKRISANTFFDITDGRYDHNNTEYTFNYKSVGTELTALTHWLRLYFPITVGCRVSYRFEDRKVRNNLLLSISF
ncbi:MAG: DUF5050 domain-containing protein [Bacteroidales bacterium]|nr:DUF5050 domain-containing protein [Bacteroidales bacterium]